MDPLIGAGIGLFGGLLNNIFAGDRQEDQQAFNAQQSALAAQFNAQQAEANRSFQGQQADASRIFTRDFGREMADRSTEFSNTAWRRGVADMRAAGINPILAASKGAASSGVFSGGSSGTPSGSSASMTPASSSIGQTFDMVGPALSTARAVQEISNMKTQQAKMEKEILTETERPSLVARQSERTQAERDVTRAHISPAEVEGTKADIIKQIQGSEWYQTLVKAGAVGDTASKITKPIGDIVDSTSRALTAGALRSSIRRRDLRHDSEFENRWGGLPGE